jgi:hypothetical protein
MAVILRKTDDRNLMIIENPIVDGFCSILRIDDAHQYEDIYSRISEHRLRITCARGVCKLTLQPVRTAGSSGLRIWARVGVGAGCPCMCGSRFCSWLPVLSTWAFDHFLERPKVSHHLRPLSIPVFRCLLIRWRVRHRFRATFSRQPRQVRKEATVTGSFVCSGPPVPDFCLPAAFYPRHDQTSLLRQL